MNKGKCEKCNEIIKKIYKLEDESIVCKECYYEFNFFNIFGYDTKVKAFVDVFISKKEDIFFNIAILDFINMDFRTITKKTDHNDINKAKYDAIVLVCQLITDIEDVTIYTHFKIMQHHVEKTYKPKQLNKEFWKLSKFLKKGLKIEFIEEEFNYAVICPHVFRIFHQFEDYNRTMCLQRKRQ